MTKVSSPGCSLTLVKCDICTGGLVFGDAWRKREGVDEPGDHGSGMDRKGDEFPLNLLTR
jgi:hypothetical protein